jgi:hypothetical protein
MSFSEYGAWASWKFRVAVTCWCERRIVHLPLAAVRTGRTISCGAPRCQDLEEMHEDARTSHHQRGSQPRERSMP